MEVLKMKYQHLADQFISAIKTLAEKPQNLDNFNHYLAYHFPEWLDKFANTPETLTAEFRDFAEMKI